MITEASAAPEKGDDVSLTPDEIRQILDVLASSAWDEAVVTVGEVTIAVARNGASLPAMGGTQPPAPVTVAAPAPESPSRAAPQAAPAPAPAPASATRDGVEVTAPSIGVFWRAPAPGAAPFVEVGQRVEVGHEMCIIEVMKLMARVAAPVAGVVTSAHVGNGEAVEFGTPLFTIAPE